MCIRDSLQSDYNIFGKDSFSYEVERVALVQPEQAVSLWNLLEMASDVRASYVEDDVELYNKIKTVDIRTETYLDLRKGKKK